MNDEYERRRDLIKSFNDDTRIACMYYRNMRDVSYKTRHLWWYQILSFPSRYYLLFFEN